MLRRLVTVLSAVSLVLCVAVCVLWGMGQRGSLVLKWEPPGEVYEVLVLDDAVLVHIGLRHPRTRFVHYFHPLTIVALTAILPVGYLAVGLWGRLRRSRRDGGQFCAACGYDLRASPGRCPECGAVPAAGIPNWDTTLEAEGAGKEKAAKGKGWKK